MTENTKTAQHRFLRTQLYRVLSGNMMARHLAKVRLMCGILRHFQAFFSLRVFPAPKQNLHPPYAGNANLCAGFWQVMSRDLCNTNM
jgi:hypothetical protein